MNGVSRETYQGYDTESKLNTLFDYVHDIREVSCKGDKELNVRVTKLETRKKLDTGIGAASGFVGGVIAFMGKHFLFKG